jgi:4-amino-4-deoxy-L-arabinose transferase-like glycosyltransferase
VLATVGADNAAGYQLATDDPVMAIGGFNGTDPAPSLAQFKAMVRAHEIHYFLASGLGGGSGSSGDARAITAWVEANFTATTVGGTTLYNLGAG